jgi:hypothetical protein
MKENIGVSGTWLFVWRDKDKALQQATKEIDRQPLSGRKTDTAQTLAFPRHPDTEVPVAVRDAENGTEATLKQVRPTGHGLQMTGYFTGYEESGSNGSVYKFSGTFRVNEREDIIGS